MEFLIHFAHAHLPFRLPELYALARIEKVHIEWCDKEHFDDHVRAQPFSILLFVVDRLSFASFCSQFKRRNTYGRHAF